MNKLVVLTKNKSTHFIKRLTEEVGSENVFLYDPWGMEGMDFKPETILARTSGIYHSDKDLEFLSEFPEAMVVNPLSALKTFRSKSSQYTFMKSHSLPSLDWMSAEVNSQEIVQSFISSLGTDEFIVKPDIGQGGWGVKNLKKSEFRDWWKNQILKKDLSWIIQPYIKGADELRVFFIKGQLLVTLKREPRRGVTSNFSQDGIAQVITLPSSIETEVESLISLSNASYGAIDLFVINRAPYFLELNTIPGIEQLEALSGLNIMKKILDANFSGQISKV